jgi:hypothetical protein
MELVRDSLDAARSELKGALAENYAVVTLHRPANVDEPEVLAQIVRALVDASIGLPSFLHCTPGRCAIWSASGWQRYCNPHPASGLRNLWVI